MICSPALWVKKVSIDTTQYLVNHLHEYKSPCGQMHKGEEGRCFKSTVLLSRQKDEI